MALKDVFNSMKREGYVIKPLNLYLNRLNEDNDRAVDVNAPSQVGQCMRHNYYMRKQTFPQSGNDARLQRIFDNGTHVHLRLQEYLLDMNLLICDEVPLINDEYNIQGHSDGFLDLGGEVAILEIKSINDNQFNQLKDAKEEHKKQGLVYLFCAESRRQYLHDTYRNRKEFRESLEERKLYFEKHYQHIVGGNKHSRASKIAHEVDCNIISDDILFDTQQPISKVIFLYENKNNQELKEFCVQLNKSTKPILDEVLENCSVLNNYCKNNEVPPREGANKSCSMCNWCQYKNECWVL